MYRTQNHISGWKEKNTLIFKHHERLVCQHVVECVQILKLGMHRCIGWTSTSADVCLINYHRTSVNKRYIHRWQWPMFMGPSLRGRTAHFNIVPWCVQILPRCLPLCVCECPTHSCTTGARNRSKRFTHEEETFMDTAGHLLSRPGWSRCGRSPPSRMPAIFCPPPLSSLTPASSASEVYVSSSRFDLTHEEICLLVREAFLFSSRLLCCHCVQGRSSRIHRTAVTCLTLDLGTPREYIKVR